MKLRRIEAVRFGGLRDASLGELGDGLTIVHGPNEAGKSTFNALVRQVLYGFPTAREKDASYQPSGDTRLGRLVFEEGSDRWVIERSEGPRRGDVLVRAMGGRERPGLLGEVTHGVSELAFRIVFGFGMDEMARIEERGSGDDIISRLYAASAGLAVSPHEVRAALERQADEIFRKGARKRELNELVGELRTTRAAIRELKLKGESFQADQQRRRDLEARLAAARAERDEARGRAVELAVASQQAAERRRVIVEQEETLRVLRLERRQREEERGAIALDEALLVRAPELDAVIEEASAFSAGCESLRTAEAAAAKARTRAADAAARTGLGEETLEALGAEHGLAAAVDEAREDLQRLQLQLETREEEAQRVASAAETAESTLERTLAPHGLTRTSVDDAIAERLAAIDALEAMRGAGGRASRGPDVPALIMLVSGAAAMVAGVALSEWVSLGVGAVLAVAATVLLLRSRAGAPTLPVGDERPYLAMLGLGSDAGALEISRTRRSLEAVRGAAAAAASARAAADDAARDAQLARQALEARRLLWAEWLQSHGLPASATPASAAQLLVLAREAHAAHLAAAETQADVERIVTGLERFAARLGDAVSQVLEGPEHIAREDVPATVNRLKERLATTRADAARAAEIGRELQSFDARIVAEAERADAAAHELRSLLEQHGLAETGTHDDLALLAAQAERIAHDAAEAFEMLAGEKNQLEGRLGGDEHERRGAELRLDEAGLQERLAEALDRYLVLSTAVRLLTDTLERYERERQPEVVKRAASIFSRITEGRYVGLSVPLTDSPIEVFDTRSGAKTSDILSLGASQQLYLALRLGLVAQLGDVGAGLPVLMDDVFAHFDRQRRHGAAEAVAELASLRQVVFFTCHPEIADLLAEVAPGHTRIDLERRS